MRKPLPLGEDDFRTVIEEGYYYVDKTLMIEDFLTYKNKVALITRPRRFGKTLNMTMLRDFFDITQNSLEIFEGLKIMGTAYRDKINSVPVISLSLKGCTGKDVEGLKKSLATEIRKEYSKYAKILEHVDQKEITYRLYFRTLEMLLGEALDEELLKHSLSHLAETLHKFYGVRPMILIDEYDNLIIEAHQLGFREAFTSFYAAFLTHALKGNVHVAQGLLTGIQRVAKESIFSKLNNMVVYSVLSKQYSTYFGLTHSETSELLRDCGLELSDDVKRFYNGYLFGGEQVYNPWSILSYAHDKILKNYWLKTSTNALIKESVLEAEPDFHHAFEELILKGEVAVRLNLEASFTELPRTDTLWGLFVNAGYLTVTKEDYELNSFTVRIPNKEIKTEFQEVVGAYTKLSSQLLQDMLIALTRGEMSNFLSIYEKLVLESTSFYDGKENAYHMLLLGMVMNLRDLYEITSNIESGYGRSDILMKSKNMKRPHIVIEFKQGEDVELLAQSALKQIFENKYYAGLQGNILCIGIAHHKKRCRLLHEVING